MVGVKALFLPKYLRFFFLLWPTLVGTSFASDFRFYAIGNSLTADAAATYRGTVYEEWFAADGVNCIKKYHVGCGKSLYYARNVAPNSPCVTHSYIWPEHFADTWDAVMLQPFEIYPSTLPPDFVDRNTVLANQPEHEIEAFMAFVRDADAHGKPRILLHTAWNSIPRDIDQPVSGVYADHWLKRFVPGSAEIIRSREFSLWFYKRIREEFRKEGITLELSYVPSGELLLLAEEYAAAGRIPGIQSIESIYRDPTHLEENIGRFLVSGLIFCILTDRSAADDLFIPSGLDLPYYEPITEEMLPVLKELITATLQQHADWPESIPLKYDYALNTNPSEFRIDFDLLSGFEYSVEEFQTDLSSPKTSDEWMLQQGGAEWIGGNGSSVSFRTGLSQGRRFFRVLRAS